MSDNEKQSFVELIENFSLPKYNEIPNVGLYLEQTAKYISEYLETLKQPALTGSMISNYVKKGLVSNPVKKQYNRKQIAYLIFIAIAKSVLSIDDIKLLIEIQKQTYPPETAYSYFEEELKNIITYVFGINTSLREIGKYSTTEKTILRNLIITVAHKVYLDNCFSELKENTEKTEPSV